MKKNTGLGKGIQAIFSENTIVPESTNIDDGHVNTVNIYDIEPNQSQPRKYFDEDKLDELSESITEFGIIQPLLVCKKGDYYEIIAGERRWRAAKKAGLKEIPVIVQERAAKEILEISLIENIQREDLNPIEEAQAYKRLIEEFKLKQEELSKRVCKSRSAISNALRLLNLNERVQQLLIQNSITSGHARCLLAITDPDQQYDLALKIMDEDLSVRQVETLIKQLKKGAKPKKKSIDDELRPIFNELEERMRQHMGTKINIVDKGKKGGKIEIEYYSMEDLERIMHIIEN